MSTQPPADKLPHSKYRRLILPPPVARQGADEFDAEGEILGQLAPGTILMMGDNPRLPPMPQQPQLLDFFKHRITDITFRHLLSSAKRALDAGHDEKIVLACLLHDISNGCLLRSDHGYWGAQMIAPTLMKKSPGQSRIIKRCATLPTIRSAINIRNRTCDSLGRTTRPPTTFGATPKPRGNIAGT
jgi:hypothetical protein